MKGSPIDAVRRFFAPGSLKYQLLSRALFILAALFLLVGALQSILMKDFVYQNKAEAIGAQIMAMPGDWFTDRRAPDGADEPEDPGMPEGSGQGERPKRSHRESPIQYQPGLSIAVIGADGTVTDISKDGTADPPVLTADEYDRIVKQLNMRRKETTYRIADNSEGEEQLVVYRQAGPPGRAEGLIQVSTETGSLRQLLMTQLAIFSGLSIAALAAGLAVYLPLLRRTLQPLSRVVRAARLTDAGSLSTRLPVSQGQEEIDSLSDAFNGMLERLDASFEAERRTTERMRRFIADASHELRTPLTSIHGFLEVLLRGAASKPEQLVRALNSMQLESKRINKLVEDLLALAKLDQEPQLQLADASLSGLLLEMEPQLRLLAGSRRVELELNDDAEGSFHADKLKQVVLNLFLNAVQHTDADSGIIRLTLGVSDGNAELTVSDNGSGIGEEHLPHLFERFYRSESSRTRKSGGAGLGLAITKAIVEAHRGGIDVESKPGDGTTFRIRLPLR
ncbi:sensor histidine kinase [Paenibacillus arenilitoris]|uniref:histidine kinase n=1 Tax=Paenibacillus arenilitoris TaxID=2772299 RepID=A0A927H935_9BACL|nr:HAMP domain-containing sensor histidine kinase [Paenibacillus arenilitoris]MBD2872690.1 HAMP domain-containing histidine kinase [Paenibacillus arenilitoris]